MTSVGGRRGLIKRVGMKSYDEKELADDARSLSNEITSHFSFVSYWTTHSHARMHKLGCFEN